MVRQHEWKAECAGGRTGTGALTRLPSASSTSSATTTLSKAAAELRMALKPAPATATTSDDDVNGSDKRGRRWAELATTRRLLAALVTERMCTATVVAPGCLRIAAAADGKTAIDVVLARTSRWAVGAAVELLDAADIDAHAPISAPPGVWLTHPAAVFDLLTGDVPMEEDVHTRLVTELANSADNQGACTYSYFKSGVVSLGRRLDRSLMRRRVCLNGARTL